MKAIIEVDVPEFQIGQEVSIYFKDTMYIHSICKKADDWISVNERSPKENGWYQCSVDVLCDSECVMDLFYKDGRWLDNRRICMFDTYSIFGYGSTCEYHKLGFHEFDDFDWTKNVKAWMPLPEPYIGDSKSYGKKNLLPYSEDVYERVERNSDPELWVHFKPESGEGVNDEQV